MFIVHVPRDGYNQSRKYCAILRVVVFDCCKNYMHGLSEIGLFNKGFIPLKTLFYTATSLQVSVGKSLIQQSGHMSV